ncbi:hypothetical protein J6590_029181 [Homalodisca vitripennis]|nr:hypothetical protein J6590_029181 [Homalodisca vitripennis]
MERLSGHHQLILISPFLCSRNDGPPDQVNNATRATEIFPFLLPKLTAQLLQSVWAAGSEVEGLLRKIAASLVLLGGRSLEAVWLLIDGSGCGEDGSSQESIVNSLLFMTL